MKPGISDTRTVSSSMFFFRVYDASPDMVTKQDAIHSVWSKEITPENDALMFYSPEVGAPDALPANHPLWDEVDEALKKIWQSNVEMSMADEAELSNQIHEATVAAEIASYQELYGDADDWS